MSTATKKLFFPEHFSRKIFWGDIFPGRHFPGDNLAGVNFPGDFFMWGGGDFPEAFFRTPSKL